VLVRRRRFTVRGDVAPFIRSLIVANCLADFAVIKKRGPSPHCCRTGPHGAALVVRGKLIVVGVGMEPIEVSTADIILSNRSVVGHA
jgi:hypothetical protein